MAKNKEEACDKAGEAFRRFLHEKVEEQLVLDSYDRDDPELPDHIEAKVAAMKAEARETITPVDDGALVISHSG